MSTPELPPITQRTSSKNSSPVSGNSKGAIIRHHERLALISLEVESPLSSPNMEHRNKKPYGGSTTSSDITAKTHSSQGVGYLKKSDRTKTWCPTSTTEPITNPKSDDQKLETLFERQTTMIVDSNRNPRTNTRGHNPSKGRSDAASQFSKTPSKATNLSTRRSVSTQDLSSQRDKNNNISPRATKKTELQRHNSEQKLTDFSNRKNSNKRQSLGYSSGDRDTTSFSRSRRTSKRETEASNQTMDEAADDAGYDSDGDRQDRIIQWLIGVETSSGELPPEPQIIDNGPTQTDTAIHIVYEGQKALPSVELYASQTCRN